MPAGALPGPGVGLARTRKVVVPGLRAPLGIAVPWLECPGRSGQLSRLGSRSGVCTEQAPALLLLLWLLGLVCF